MRLPGLACLIALLLAPQCLAAAVHVQVQALFKGRAMLQINGQQQLLKAGETGTSGVRLIDATSKYADIEIDGEVRRVTMSGGIHSNFTAPEEELVSILADPDGAYHVHGSINGQPVRFLVDTGASSVAMNGAQARRLGIDFVYLGRPGMVTTASGSVQAYALKLDRVQVGVIEVQNVDAVVIEGNYPQSVLLGMTFLREVEIREKEGLMELRR